MNEGTQSVRKSASKRANNSISEASRPKRKRFEHSEFSREVRKFYEDERPAEIFTFGSGDAGQLGLGEDIFERKRPTKVPELQRIIRIRSGGMHTICLSDEGEVYSFGCNDEGALGRVLEEDEEATVPKKVYFNENVKIIDISAGDSHSTALTSDGTLYIWGVFRDNNGIIGLLEADKKEMLPVALPFTDDNRIITKVVSGDNHVAFLMDDGEVYTFGVSENGQLGRVAPSHLVRGGRLGLEILLTPTRVRTIKTMKYVDLWAGSYCTIGRGVDNKLYGCGLNNYHQLDNSNEMSILMMSALKSWNALDRSIRQIGFGQHHMVALTESNEVYTVGRGEYGSLGLGNNNNQDKPQHVVFENSSGILNIACCNRTSYTIMKDGSVVAWGSGSSYMLGNGEEDDMNTPIVLTGKQLTNMKVIELSPGAQHVAIRAISANSFNQSVTTSVASVLASSDYTSSSARPNDEPMVLESTNLSTINCSNVGESFRSNTTNGENSSSVLPEVSSDLKSDESKTPIIEPSVENEEPITQSQSSEVMEQKQVAEEPVLETNEKVSLQVGQVPTDIEMSDKTDSEEDKTKSIENKESEEDKTESILNNESEDKVSEIEQKKSEDDQKVADETEEPIVEESKTSQMKPNGIDDPTADGNNNNVEEHSKIEFMDVDEPINNDFNTDI